VGNFKPQEVANVLWALATMGQKADRGLLEAIQGRATATAGDFKPQEVANVLWALATMGESADRGLLEAIQGQATATAKDFKPQEVSNMLWALAVMGESVDRGLLEAMQRQATATAGSFKPQGVANVLWALAMMGESADRGLLEAMGSQATATAGDFKPQEVANVLWALAVVGDGCSVGTLDVIFDSLAARVLELRYELTVEHKVQLHQWLLSCEMGLVPGDSLSSGVARVKQEMGGECYRLFLLLPPGESRLQREVAAALQTIPEVEVEEEYRDSYSGHTIDVLVRRGRGKAVGSLPWPLGGGKSLDEPAIWWAVEADGPTHFLGDGRAPSGSTLLKRKQLGQLGYTVLPVPFWEWEALVGVEAQRRYVEDKLTWFRV